MKRVAPDQDGLAQAAEAIRAGGVVAYPTETVYGLGADPFNPAALDALFALKRRDAGNPVLLIVADETQLEDVAGAVPETARRLMQAFWPGPLSLLFPRAPSLPDALTAGRPSVCVRCPGLKAARALCEAAGHAVTSTSANRSGCPPALSLDDLGVAGVALAVDGGTLDPSPPSTVFDPASGRVLREGAVPREAILAVLRA